MDKEVYSCMYCCSKAVYVLAKIFSGLSCRHLYLIACYVARAGAI